MFGSWAKPEQNASKTYKKSRHTVIRSKKFKYIWNTTPDMVYYTDSSIKINWQKGRRSVKLKWPFESTKARKDTQHQWFKTKNCFYLGRVMRSCGLAFPDSLRDNVSPGCHGSKGSFLPVEDACMPSRGGRLGDISAGYPDYLYLLFPVCSSSRMILTTCSHS